MILSPWELLVLLLAPAFLGMALLRLQGVGPRTDALAFGGWAWIQGCLGLALLLSAWLWLELPLRAGWIAPVVFGLGALFFVLGRRVPLVPPSESPPFPRWERVCFALALVLLLLTTVDRILLASRDVLAATDEGLIWAAKARVLFHTSGFGDDFRAAMRTPGLVGHPDYPPLNPLLQLWVYVHAGEIVYVESRLPIQVFSLVGILVAASAVRRRSRPLVAAVFLVCIASIGRFFTYQVFSEILISVGLLTCWDLWQRYQEDGRILWLHLLGTTAPVLVWSKNEGSLQVVAFGLALLAALLARRVRVPRRSEIPRLLAWTVPLGASLLYLHWFNWHFGLLNDLLDAQVRAVTDAQDFTSYLGQALGQAASNVRPILAYWASLAGPQAAQSQGLFAAFLALLVLSPSSACGKGRLVFTLGLLLTLLGYMAVYLRTPWDVEVHLRHSASRLLYHLSPSMGLWVLLYVGDVLPSLTPSARASPGPKSAASAPAGRASGMRSAEQV